MSLGWHSRTMSLIALASLPLFTQASASAAPTSTLRVPPGKGVVIGHIDRCSGLPLHLTGDRRYDAGIVTVFRGRLRWNRRHTLYGFPTQIVQRADVTAHGGYHFALAPGSYVFRARYSRGNARSWVQVRVKPRVTLHVDLPNMCK